MTRRVLIGFTATAILVAGTSAMAQTSPAAPAAVTIVGCVAPDTSADARTGDLVLIETAAVPHPPLAAGAQGSDQRNSVGTSGTPEPQTYSLKTKRRMNLKKEVGKKVEVKGTVKQADANGSN